MEKGLVKVELIRKAQDYVESHPLFNVNFSLGFMNKKELPDIDNWTKAEKTILNNSGIPAAIDYRFVEGLPIIPEFLFNRGYASWQNAILTNNNEIVSPNIKFSYVLSDLKNKTERRFIRDTIIKLEKKVFGYIQDNNHLTNARDSMQINYWMKVYSRLEEKIRGRKFEEPFLRHSMQRRTQGEIFDDLFREIDRYLNGIVTRKNSNKTVKFKAKTRALIKR